MDKPDRPDPPALPDIEVSGHSVVHTSGLPDDGTTSLRESTPSGSLFCHSSNAVCASAGGLSAVCPSVVCPPQLVRPREQLAWEEFISGFGPLTQIVYARAVRRFLAELDAHGLSVATGSPAVVRCYLDALHARPGHRQRRTSRAAAIRTRKQHLAAIRHFYHHMVQRHAAVINPAASVRSPRLSVERGETIAIPPDQVRQTLEAIDTRSFLGHRDHTLILTLAITAARVGAIATLTRSSIVLAIPRGAAMEELLILREKNDKRRQLPMTAELRQALVSWLQRLGPADTCAPVFPSTRNNQPTERQLTSQDIRRIVRRRFLAAGVTMPGLTCHSFRAGAATALLSAGVELTRVQDLLGHADPRTTRLYDARSRQAQMDTVSRLSRFFTESE